MTRTCDNCGASLHGEAQPSPGEGPLLCTPCGEAREGASVLAGLRAAHDRHARLRRAARALLAELPELWGDRVVDGRVTVDAGVLDELDEAAGGCE